MPTVELVITGMTCNHCVARTARALEAIPAVDSVEVTLEPGGAVVKGTADASALIEAVKEAGYSADVKS